MSDDDRALVERSQAGDLAAFERLVEKYRERAYRLAARVLGDPEEALDVAQEAFVKAYQALPRFKGQSAFYTWLFRIVMNLALDRHRQRAARHRAFGSEQVPPEEWERTAADEAPDAAQTAASAEDRAKITRALDALPEHHRAIIILSDIEGLSYREIAHVLGCPLGTVMSRLHNARKRLRAILGPLLALLVFLFLAASLTAPAWAQGPLVTIRARIFLASNAPLGPPPGPPPAAIAPAPREPTPQARPFIGRLREVFGYQHYQPLDDIVARLPMGGAQRFSLPGGRELEIHPVGRRGPVVRMDVKIWRVGVQELATILDVPPGRPAVIGGPPYGPGVLIIAITAQPD